MAEKLTFTSVELIKFTRDKNATKATFSAGFSSDVIAKMGWTEIPECLTGGSLEGELAVTALVLTPNDAGLKRHMMDLEGAMIHSFATVRLELEGKRGKGHRTELRFVVTSQDQNAARKLEQYIISCGRSKMSISYEPAPKQGDLPGTGVDSGCVACNNGIPLVAGTRKHESGARCTAAAQEPLPS
jgi:hypothetical protein